MKNVFGQVICLMVVIMIMSLSYNCQNCEQKPSQQPLPENPAQVQVSDFRNFMPLAVGNSWTYKWTAERNYYSTNYQPQTDYIDVLFLEHYVKTPQSFVETYTITGKKGDNYLFTISTDDNHQARDGRYKHSENLNWSWEIKSMGRTKHFMLYETMDFSLGSPIYEQPGMAQPEKRTALVISQVDNQLADISDKAIIMPQGYAYTTRFELKTITVPAGTFTGCLETTEVYIHKEDNQEIVWIIQCFWAPGVGKIKEVQISEPKTKTLLYTMELLSYQLN